ncbi:molybdopterin-dependent oxidoreductase [Saccharopolyspora phatthalungensis]|uniref:molybdopterin-dependent oxidoreductase n=1 Tax=Saccharopolyspora phatthalungensis TaxID=664693 RepID=UPI0028ABC882|nr:molybdopterin-dependent oxidoreductase [Saccharopolyspora phatthalungensis]
MCRARPLSKHHVSEIASPPGRFGASIPASKARSGEVLLAWAMNHAWLPAVHGAPCPARPVAGAQAGGAPEAPPVRASCGVLVGAR